MMIDEISITIDEVESREAFLEFQAQFGSLQSAILEVGAAYEQMGRSAKQAREAILRAFAIADPRSIMTTGGRLMFWVGRRFLNLDITDAAVWCRQFPGAFMSDFQDGW